MRVIRLVAGLTIVWGLCDASWAGHFDSVVTGAAFGGEVFATQVLVSNLNLENVVHAGVLLGPSLGGMTGKAVRSIGLGVLYLVASSTIQGEALELTRAKRTSGNGRFMTFNALDDDVLAGEREGRIAIMKELRLADRPGCGGRMAFDTGLAQLPPVRLFVAIGAFELESDKPGRAERLTHRRGDMAIFAGHGEVLTDKLEF